MIRPEKSPARYFLLFIVALSFSLNACKKSAVDDPGANPDPEPPPTSTSFPKKYVADSTVSDFVSTDQEIISGVFKYNTLPGTDSMKKGDFFIEPRDSGYLRKVETITRSNGQVVITTTAAALSEFYRDSGRIVRNFNIDATENPLARKASVNGKTQVSFPTVSISGDKWNLVLENLLFSFDPNFNLEFDVKDKYLKAGFVNSQTKMEYDVTLTSELTGSASKEFKLSSVAPNLVKMMKVRIPNLFMQIHLMDVIVKVTVEGGGKISKKWSYKNHYVSNAYLEYKNAALGGTVSNGNSLYEYKRTMSLVGGVGVKVELYPIFRIREFGIPIINLGVKGVYETEVRHSVVSDTWDLKSEVYGGFFGNFNKTAFQFVAPEEYIIKTPPYTLVEAPKTLKHLSGGNEPAQVNTALKNPIEFQVFEKNNLKDPDPEIGVNVFFSSNYGTWTNAKVRTDVNGKVKNGFTMGPEEKEHILTAVIKNADNQVIDTKVIKLTPGVDTAALLQSHGPWKATEGSFDGSPLGSFTPHQYVEACNSGPGEEIIDEVTLGFGSNAAATISVKGRVRCSGSTTEIPISDATYFQWDFLPGLKKIRATSLTDDTFFDMEIGDYFDFTILSFSATEMEISGTPPGYDNIRLKLK